MNRVWPREVALYMDRGYTPTTTFLGIAPADPDEQLAMVQELAELIFTRLVD